VAVGDFATKLRELFDRMLEADELVHLGNHRACGLYVLSAGFRRVKEELERDA
jgi:hypothetical protein